MDRLAFYAKHAVDFHPLESCLVCLGNVEEGAGRVLLGILPVRAQVMGEGHLERDSGG